MVEAEEPKKDTKKEKLTPERKQEIDVWLDTKLCPVYRNPTKIELARSLLHKMNLQDKYLEEILNTVYERNRYRQWCKKNNQFWPEDPNLFTFIKDRVWKDPIPSCIDQQISQDESPRELCGCGSFSSITISATHYCAWCWSKKYAADRPGVGINALREFFKTHGLAKKKDETQAEYIARLKAHSRASAQRIGTGKAGNVGVNQNQRTDESVHSGE